MSFRTQCYDPKSSQVWEEIIEYFVSTPQHRELDNIDGEPVVFKWKIFPGHTTLDLLQEVQELIEKELKIQPQNFEDRIIFMSMYNDIDWTRKGNQQVCEENASRGADYARHFSKGHWSQEKILNVGTCAGRRKSIRLIPHPKKNKTSA